MLVKLNKLKQNKMKYKTLKIFHILWVKWGGALN